MNVFGIGLPELAVIAAIGLLVFGPKRLPELGKTLGRTLKGFQSASSEFEREFRASLVPPDLGPEGERSPAQPPAAAAQLAASDFQPAPLQSAPPQPAPWSAVAASDDLPQFADPSLAGPPVPGRQVVESAADVSPLA
jgi:sec-independent protein translocase protein TatA